MVIRESAPSSSGPLLKVLWRLSLFMFAIGLLLVDRFPTLATPNRIIGIVFAGVGLSIVLRYRRVLSVELFLFALFLLWAVTTGFLVAVETSVVRDYTRLLTQTWFLAMGVNAYVWFRRSGSDVFRAMLVVAVVSACYLFLGGELARIHTADYARAQSLVNNPNYLGFLALWGVMSIAWLWPEVGTTLLRKTSLIGLIFVFVFVAVMSASRKTFLVMVAFSVIWYWFVQLRARRGRLIDQIATLCVVGVLVWITVTVLLPGTTLETRFQMAADDPRFSSDRANLYSIGLELFETAPVTGVGLGNFAILSGTGQYSHSDAMEVLSTTGLIGFILYFSIYGRVLLRFHRLRTIDLGPVGNHQVRVGKGIIVGQMLLGLGAPLFFSPFHWMILVAIVATADLWTKAVRRNRLAVEANAHVLPGSQVLVARRNPVIGAEGRERYTLRGRVRPV